MSPKTTYPEPTALLPHRPPMLRLDRLLYAEQGAAKGCFAIQPDDPFLEGSALCEEALIETAAQTMAATQGWLALQQGEAIPEGLLIGVEAMVFHRPVVVGDELLVSIEVILQKASLHIVEAWIWVGEELVAEGKLKFYVGPQTS